MKRQRNASVGSADASGRPAVCLQAASVWAKSAPAPGAPRSAPSDGPDVRVWARYIDSRMKQFGTR